ncbi:hypothetical protein ACFE04_025163 [Oxalis oulophora]
MVACLDEINCHRRSLLSMYPPGYRFVPTEEELVIHYLRNKALNQPLPAEIIQEIDESKFYNEHPKTIYGSFHAKAPNKLDVEGWKLTGEGIPILNSNDGPLALKKSLAYYSENSGVTSRTHWKIEEYQVPSYQKDWALIRMKRGENYRSGF